MLILVCHSCLVVVDEEQMDFLLFLFLLLVKRDKNQVLCCVCVCACVCVVWLWVCVCVCVCKVAWPELGEGGWLPGSYSECCEWPLLVNQGQHESQHRAHTHTH